MEELNFKTTIKCTGCLEKVTPELNSTDGIEEWKVNLDNPDKILSVKSKNATESAIMEAVKRKGFEIERI